MILTSLIIAGMDSSILEVGYPLSFREEDCKILGEHLRHRHSVELVGMKRVGISNFLRFFLYKKGVHEKFINGNESHFFVIVDLNDLVEREIQPFWILTFKRLVDDAERFKLSEDLQKELSKLFLASIESRDLFFTIENFRKALVLIVADNKIPTIFFLRFDRLKDVVTPVFFDNLLGLKEATNQKLSYVFTSYRSLDELSPDVFSRKSHSLFSDILYLKPASETDSKTILSSFEERYHTSFDESATHTLLKLCGGHTQYMHLLFMQLNQTQNGKTTNAIEELSKSALTDERITLQSEEIYESLTSKEKEVLSKLINEQSTSEEERQQAKYIWNTGIVIENGSEKVFSLLFSTYLKQVKTNKTSKDEVLDFSKKENSLFTLLLENINEICEREKIIQSVWPEDEEFGVSDWTIDRLVARVRAKLKKQSSKYEIVTIKTRGYKLVENN